MATSSSQLPLMNDEEIQARVSSLAGPNAKILDCEKKSSLITEEVLLLNGQPVRLVGEAGEKIKAAMKAGLPPPPEILSEILIRNGIQTVPVQVETVTTVKSNTKTSEVSTLTDSQGILVDEKMKEFEEDDEFESTNVEVWEREPAKLREQLEMEKSRMWDFYNSSVPLSKGSIFKENKGPSANHEVPHAERPRSAMSMGSTSSTPSSSGSPIHFAQRVPERNSNDNPSYPLSSRTRSPGKMPPLSIPSDPKLRPPVPPKPKGIRLGSGYVANLRTDKNLVLPVRVVYETFI